MFYALGLSCTGKTTTYVQLHVYKPTYNHPLCFMFYVCHVDIPKKPHHMCNYIYTCINIYM